jgi:hypothetical protein
MSDEEAQVPEGAAVFPQIPPELGIHPLLLATLHATVFLTGSDEAIVQPDAADEALEHLAGYLQRLEGPELARVREDLECLAGFGRQEGWPRQLVRFLRDFLSDFGVEGPDEA